MIEHIVSTERKRLEAEGYETTVTPVSLTITSAQQLVHLGNDTYVLTGIRLAEGDVVSRRTSISITSATDGMTMDAQEINTMGTSMLKTFREFVIVKTMRQGETWRETQTVEPYRLDFIKISPKKKRN